MDTDQRGPVQPRPAAVDHAETATAEGYSWLAEGIPVYPREPAFAEPAAGNTLGYITRVS